jgi:small subunit ribosomal protein S17
MDNIGIPGVQAPKKQCTDAACPFHGDLKVRGRVFVGKVISAKMMKTIVVGMDYFQKDKKYQRWARKRSRIHAHLPECIEVAEGETVRIMECRPIAKTVKFVVVEKTKELNK